MNYESFLWSLIYDQYNHGRHELEYGFYLSELKNREGPVLELGCGTGMILLKMLEEDIDIFGIDISSEMLNVLIEKAIKKGYLDIEKRVKQSNMVDLNYDFKFSDVIIPARSFLHLTKQDEQINCLRNIYNHLNDRGRLLLNFFNPNLSALIKYIKSNDEFKYYNTFNDSTNKSRKIKLYFKQMNNISDQIQDIKWKFKLDGKESESNMKIRWIYKEEFKLLLRLAGFNKWQLYGDFDKNSFNNESNEMVWITEK